MIDAAFGFPEVEDLHEHGESDGEIQVPPGDVESDPVGDQYHSRKTQAIGITCIR